MRPEHLILPFSSKTRTTSLNDHVWYIPSEDDTQIDFAFPGWDDPAFFASPQPICIEYCSGNGAWIVAKAIAHPEYNWVAIEKRFIRARKIWSKIKNHRLTNLLVICGEGHHVTQRFFPSSSVSQVYINFPDPWPKRRHAPNRLIQPQFLLELSRILNEDCELSFVTDDIPYSQSFIQMILKNPCFVPKYPSPFYIIENPDYGTSYFDQLWREKGKTIRYHHFIKRFSPVCLS